MTLGTPHLHLRAHRLHERPRARARGRRRAARHARDDRPTRSPDAGARAGRGRRRRGSRSRCRSCCARSRRCFRWQRASRSPTRSAAAAAIKWPNDILIDGRKVAGILAEARPREGWAILGIGINVALRPDDFPPELRDRAGTLGRTPDDVPAVLAAVLASLERRLAQPADRLLDAWRARDALAGRLVTWEGGRGTADGIDEDGRLRVRLAGGGTTALDAGEVHLGVPL